MDYSNLLNQAQVYGGEVGERKAEEERDVDKKAEGEASIGSQLEQIGVPAGAAVAAGIAKTEAGQRGIAAAKQAAQGAVERVAQAVRGPVESPGEAPADAAATTTEAPASGASATEAPAADVAGDVAADAADVAGADAAAEGVGAALDATGILAPIGALISLFAPAVAGALTLQNAHHETDNDAGPDLSGVGAPTYTPGLN